ncbi:CBO0543 family protein [Bacillus sp. 2205SS5-2]|uniref:CBO0543 family protein n=1 Tax=Bacillus sp. 2205SS5-2 TaxID=3109031 RepID=UPI0030061B8F
MKKVKKDRRILYLLTIIGLLLLPFTLKKPAKDWLFVYFFHAFLSIVQGSLVTGRHFLTFPVRFFPKIYRSSLLFDGLLFPIIAVLHNQWTFHSKRAGIVVKALMFSTPMTIGELWFENNTQLISYKKWTWITTLTTVTINLLFTRGVIGLIRRWCTHKESEPKQFD